MLEEYDRIKTIYENIKPPKPSNIKKDTVLVKNMSQHSNTYNTVCVGENSLISIVDETFKCIKYIKKGDIVKTQYGHSKVSLVIKSIFDHALIVKIKNLEITPWHPIFFKNKWVFPADIGKTEEYNGKTMYNLILEKDYIYIADGIQCISMYHNIDALKHEYLGTQIMMDDLKSSPEFSSGMITISDRNIKRNINNNNCISKFIF
jgi:hypothetical protein